MILWFLQLHHNDRLVLAGTYYFRVGIPGDGTNSRKEDSRKLDFYFTDQELLKEQERRFVRSLVFDLLN